MREPRSAALDQCSGQTWWHHGGKHEHENPVATDSSRVALHVVPALQCHEHDVCVLPMGAQTTLSTIYSSGLSRSRQLSYFGLSSFPNVAAAAAVAADAHNPNTTAPSHSCLNVKTQRNVTYSLLARGAAIRATPADSRPDAAQRETMPVARHGCAVRFSAALCHRHLLAAAERAQRVACAHPRQRRHHERAADDAQRVARRRRHAPLQRPS